MTNTEIDLRVLNALQSLWDCARELESVFPVIAEGLDQKFLELLGAQLYSDHNAVRIMKMLIASPGTSVRLTIWKFESA
ncbi:MAG: hypothetical protein WC054_00150 [Candidatus Nanopelagicales bacterium]